MVVLNGLILQRAFIGPKRQKFHVRMAKTSGKILIYLNLLA